MRDFAVTYERFNDAEAMRGTTRHGFCARGLTLREALAEIRRETPAASETRGRYASDSRPYAARWFSVEYDCWEDGESLTLSIHFPESATPATRARLCRLLRKVP